MKKLAFVLALTLAMASFAGCAGAASSAPASSAPASSAPASSEPVLPEQPAESLPEGEDMPMEGVLLDVEKVADASIQLEGTLEEIMDSVLAGFGEDELPPLMPADLNGGSKYTPITADTAEYQVGVAADRFKEGIAADAAMSAIAHSVCLVRADSAEDAAQLAADIEAGANPRKWICVGAEGVVVDYAGDVVILIMTNADLATRLHANFAALAQ